MSPADDALVEKIKLHAAGVNHTILSYQEIHRGREILSIEKHILSEIDLEIKALLAKRDWQQQHVAKFSLALAPHKRVPPELLSRIFFYCLPDETVDFKVSIPPKLSQAPWLPGQVCSLWRQISRNDPHLWGEASIDMDNQAHRQNLTRLCENLPTKVTLSVKICRRSGHAKAVTKIIIPNLWRLQKLDLELDIRGYDMLWRITRPDSFANLQSAVFHLSQREPISLRQCAGWKELTPFRLAGMLRSLTLEGPEEFSLAFLYFAIPWGQLTSLSILGVEGVSLSAAFQILQRCSSLEWLNVKMKSSDPAIHFPKESMPMHALRTLVVDRSLPLGFIDGTDLWKHLSTLDLKGVVFKDGRLLHSIIKQSPSLTKLIALVPHKGTAYTTDGDLPLPHLTTLQLLGIHDTWIFKSLITPELTSLGATFTIQPDLAPIRNMLISSGCSLFRLTLAFVGAGAPNIPGQPTGLHDLLTAIPQAVDLIYIAMEDPILADIGRDTLLPHVEFLFCCPTSLEAFFDMLETRLEREFRENRARLRDVGIEFPQEAHESPAVKAAATSHFEVLRRTYGIRYWLHR